ncbi:unnamed protein product [Clonostachys rosea]|uniref:beta-glucosidase n=1 Tax=Bionectria ochroleuca TaxID=29856 RepID=A0ABY6TXJ0_BIOOC|nr:unnamed protein product [Clonostachys rosea]
MSTLKSLILVFFTGIPIIGVYASSSQYIPDDTFFYGQSPPVYPSPIGSGRGTWAGAYEKARALVSQMSLEEKVNLTNGIPALEAGNGCIGNSGAIPRLGFPGLCFQDSGQGVHAAELVNGYPGGLHVGARKLADDPSWNKELTYQRGLAMGGEFRIKGVNVVNGPGIYALTVVVEHVLTETVPGPLGRVATGGRNWEGFSNDPYLSGLLTGITVKGIQQRGVIASVKLRQTQHLIGNEQESNRNPSVEANGTKVEAVSSNIDDKTMHELYLWAWAGELTSGPLKGYTADDRVDAVRAGCGGVMCSYQRINNSYACANSKVLNGLLKTELGFDGFVVADWNAQHAGVATANAGLDLTMPTVGFWGSELVAAVKNGSVDTTRLDDMATRLVASWYQMSQDLSYPDRGVGLPINIFAPHTPIDARNSSSKAITLNGAIEGHVLVKNIRNALPLKKSKLLSLYGYSATVARLNNPDLGAINGQPPTQTPDPKAYAWMLGFESYVPEDAFRGFLRLPYSREISHIAPKGTIIAGGGGGSLSPTYISAPLDALQDRASRDGTALFWDFENLNATGRVVGSTDACLVFLNAFASESYDRPGLRDDYSDALVNNIADQCANTIVIIHNAGVRLVDQFADHPNVTAIIFAHVPGQDSGSALVSLLYGDVSFSGKLPYTVPKNESDYTEGTFLPTTPEASYKAYPQSDFVEGVYIDYRSFDKRDITPRYEFGFGLSYTTFVYSDLMIKTTPSADLSLFPSGDIQQGGEDDLWDEIIVVTARLTNSGTMHAAEVSQLYVGIPGGPLRQLRGFEKTFLQSGSTAVIAFTLLRRDLSTWDVGAQMWLLQKGEYQFYVGASSRNIALTGAWTLE